MPTKVYYGKPFYESLLELLDRYDLVHIRRLGIMDSQTTVYPSGNWKPETGHAMQAEIGEYVVTAREIPVPSDNTYTWLWEMRGTDFKPNKYHDSGMKRFNTWTEAAVNAEAFLETLAK